MSMGKYELVCQEDGEVFEDGYGLFCPSGHKGLMRTWYEVREFSPRPCEGIFKFYDWLPVRSVYETDSPSCSGARSCPRNWVSTTSGSD